MSLIANHRVIGSPLTGCVIPVDWHEFQAAITWRMELIPGESTVCKWQVPKSHDCGSACKFLGGTSRPLAFLAGAGEGWVVWVGLSVGGGVRVMGNEKKRDTHVH